MMRRSGRSVLSAAAVLLVLLAGCASSTPRHTANPLDKWDPIEPFNRHVYRFNAGFDHWVLLPVIRVYDYVPEFARKGVRNVFSNFDEITTFINCVLQGAPKRSATTLARFLVNSTVGIGGLLDPASSLGLAAYDEDFGQTLGRWGLGPGPYLVIPIFGPSSLRDATGLAVDRVPLWPAQAFIVGDIGIVLSVITPIEVVSDRDWNDFRYGELGPFEYELVRYMYLEYRKELVEDAE